LNVDDSEDIATKFKIKTIPTLIIFIDGAVKETIIGRLTKRELIARIEAVLKDSSADLTV
jgi:thioredoxin